jgi:uncharacterized phage protein gp47/JayE
MSTFDFSSIEYTNKDFNAIRSRLISTVKTIFPDWEDESVAALGNMLLESYAFVGDIINFYNDSNRRESFTPTAKRLQSMLLIAEQLSLTLPLQEAATATLTASLDSHPLPITIPIFSKFRTVGEGSRQFQNLTELTIPENTTEYTFDVENSEIKEQLIIPTGNAWWKVWLDQIPYLDMISVSSDGQAWTKVNNLVNSDSNDNHYKVIVNSNGRAQLQFGNGILGKIPTEEMTVTYKIGGGSSGNVSQNTITQIENTIYDIDENQITLSITNKEAASGGSDRVSVDECRRLIPAGTRSKNNTISNTDFVDAAINVPGVARALMLTSNEDPGIYENTGRLLIVPEGGGSPSQALIDDVEYAITEEKPQTITFRTSISGPLYKPINIYAKVYREEGVSESDLGSTIRNNLDEFFSIRNPDNTINEKINFGGAFKNYKGETDPSLAYSDIYNVIRDSNGARKLGIITLNSIAADVQLKTNEFPILGNVTLVDGNTGNNL